jgi:nucleotide-binding universal stress UspA family protein
MEPETETSPRPVIIVGTDFSATAAAAMDWAAELARQQGARIELVHAVTIPLSTPGFVPVEPQLSEEVQQAARDRLGQAAEVLHGKGIAVDTYLGLGTPAQVILERAEDTAAELVAVGTRGLSGLSHLLLGSTAQRVIQGSACPVLSVHPGDLDRHRPIRTILVPTDFSDDSERAVHTALQLLAPLEQEARLTLVHAFNLPIEYTAYGPIPTSIHFLRDTGLEAERRLQEKTEALEREGLTVDWVAREGDPAAVIAHEAEARDADLIAMGTHGRSGLMHLLLGSTAERVVQHAPCPVMTVRRPK